MKTFFAVLSLVVTFATSVNAGLITVGNPSFEDDALANGGFIIPPSSWVATGTGGAQNPTSTAVNETTVDGLNTGWINTGGGSLYQNLGVNFIEGNEYTLTVAVVRRKDFAAFFDDTEWKISLSYADGTEIAAQIGTIVDDSRGGPAEGDFADVSLVYTASAGDAGQEIRVTLWNNDTVIDFTSIPQSNYDNVRLVTVVPEPASLALMGLSGLLLISRRRWGL